MIANTITLSHWKHKAIQWRKQAHVLGVIFGVALWAMLAVGWPVILVVWLVLNR